LAATAPALFAELGALALVVGVDGAAAGIARAMERNSEVRLSDILVLFYYAFYEDGISQELKLGLGEH
jgi:hypothetical protein